MPAASTAAATPIRVQALSPPSSRTFNTSRTGPVARGAWLDPPLGEKVVASRVYAYGMLVAVFSPLGGNVVGHRLWNQKSIFSSFA